ncbi:MAG: hypothetical protein N0E48_25015, partial [Candidatus Thiodiazotropha endolucinida]|nr:hypothetical protein [Candidatus Thiodiazotropha taylori]MCW4346587.1 hypothetical protein [Candidatus Thiodiazotropha endolucinida]
LITASSVSTVLLGKKKEKKRKKERSRTSFVLCFMFSAVQFLNVLMLTLLCVQFVWFGEGDWVAACLGKGLLTRLVNCNFIVCEDVFVHLSL